MSAEKVLETMKAAGKPLKAGEIATASGLDKKEVDKAMKILKRTGSHCFAKKVLLGTKMKRHKISPEFCRAYFVHCFSQIQDVRYTS